MKRSLEITSHPQNLKVVREFVRECLAELPLSHTQTEMVVLGVDEACSNVIRHAYQGNYHEVIQLSCECSATSLCFTVRDYGIHSDPSKFHGRPLDHLRPGGLGIHLIHHAFDHIDYKPLDEGTQLTLIKHFH